MMVMPRTLVAAAVAVGRTPGEPPTILSAGRIRPLRQRLAGTASRRPLADPRLEVLRAISASLTRGASTIPPALLAAAYRVGWSNDDLSLAFPTVSTGAV